MKKETRVKDLKVDLIKLLINELNFNEPFRDVLECDAMPFLKIIDWTKATDAERLAYCEVRYPKGTKYKNVLELYKHETNESDGVARLNETGGVYDGYTGKFAEIIEEVETIKEAPAKHQDQFVKANPDMSHSVEFKEGEMVEVNDGGFAWVKRKYRFFAENKYWFGNSEGLVLSYKFVRKIDPDKELKELADEVMKDYYKHSDYKLSPSLKIEVKSMLIEMGKKVQAKK